MISKEVVMAKSSYNPNTCLEGMRKTAKNLSHDS